MVLATMAYSVGVLAHRALEFSHGVGGADEKVGDVRAGPRTSWAARQQGLLVRDVPADPPTDDVASMKSELAEALSRAAALVPEEDVLWMVGQVYALNRAHAAPSARAGTSP